MDVCAALRHAAGTARDANEFLALALRILAERFDAAYSLAQLETATGARRHEVARAPQQADEWKRLADALLLEARYHNVGKARLSAAGIGGQAALAVPLSLLEQEPNGAIALIVPDLGKAVMQARLGEFKALAALAGSLYQPAPTKPAATASGDEARASQSLTKAAAYDNLRHFVFGVVNSLKSRTGCEQVALGLVRGANVRIECISGLDDVLPRSPGVREMQQAMEECLDAGVPVGWQRTGQPFETATPTGQLLHKQWHQHIGGATVASIPLTHEGRVVAVVSFRADSQEQFSRDLVTDWAGLLAPIAPVLLVLARAERGIARHISDRAREGWRAIRTAPRVRQCLYLALLPALGWLLFGSTTYVVTVPCEIIAAEERRIAAPFEGTLLRAAALPGERVHAGQVLAEFDTRDILLKRDKVAAQLRAAELELTAALQEQDTVAAGMTGAQAEMHRAELELLDYQLERAKIVAPADGIILEGDLRRRIGEIVPLGEPLYSIAANDRCAIELHAPEHAAVLLKAGQSGVFTTLAQPDEQGQLRLLNVEPLAQVVDAHNVFRAEAQIEASPDWVRVGMSGVARVETGRRPVYWALLHRAVDAVRLQWWKL
jgi:multidrug resistance efflux pump